MTLPWGHDLEEGCEDEGIQDGGCGDIDGAREQYAGTSAALYGYAFGVE